MTKETPNPKPAWALASGSLILPWSVFRLRRDLKEEVCRTCWGGGAQAEREWRKMLREGYNRPIKVMVVPIERYEAMDAALRELADLPCLCATDNVRIGRPSPYCPAALAGSEAAKALGLPEPCKALKGG